MFNGNKFKNLRKNHNMLQSDVAKRMNVSTSTIGMWEQGRNQPDGEMIKKIANLFNVTTDYLLDNDITSKAVEKVASGDEEFNAKLKQLAEDEFDKTLFKKYGDLTDEQKKLIMSVINGIIDEASQEIK